MKALFVGRFQPFHNGHLKAIDYVSRIADSIVIGVGSSQESNTLENPFSYEERKEMIEKSLKVPAAKFSVHPIPDFGDEAKWVAYIRANLPAFDTVFTNAPREKKIFRNANVPVLSVPLYDRTLCNATDIRRKMSSKDKWEALVPKETASVIKKAGGVGRITKLVLA
ncbi:MAG: nicotinamide-nucleotide adenylyltransferase [Candidatus Altiarchaeota archaeon]|nr:nicotinamide-nucleotide adenylyltransferase [Candidatus Altiarchaeota archaeon]